MQQRQSAADGVGVGGEDAATSEQTSRSQRRERRERIFTAARKGPLVAFLLVLVFGPLGALYLRPLYAFLFVVCFALAYFLHWSLAIAVWCGFAIIAPMQAISLNKRLKRRIKSYVH